MFLYYTARRYRELAKLMLVCRRIEKNLNQRGGEGKGMWEKAKCIEKSLPSGMVDRIFEVAEIRNNAIHTKKTYTNMPEIIEKAVVINKELNGIISHYASMVGEWIRIVFLRGTVRSMSIAIYLTKELEHLLVCKGAQGFSLSDKVKSFDDYEKRHKNVDLQDNDEAYAYREYKRNLLGGNYNNLRHIAHERNMFFHTDRYKIRDFGSFKFDSLVAIIYLKNRCNHKLEKMYRLFVKIVAFRMFLEYRVVPTLYLFTLIGLVTLMTTKVNLAFPTLMKNIGVYDGTSKTILPIIISIFIAFIEYGIKFQIARIAIQFIQIIWLIITRHYKWILTGIAVTSYWYGAIYLEWLGNALQYLQTVYLIWDTSDIETLIEFVKGWWYGNKVV